MGRYSAICMVLAGLAACVDETAVPSAAEVERRVARIESGLGPTFTIRGETPSVTSIEERMRELRVPGVSVAVVNGNRIEWARGWGVADTESGSPVTENTMFQAASISKPVAALAALRLVEAGEIDLDSDVNQWLTSWKLPENEFTTDSKVTLRRLLTHTAGTSVWGFPGYGPGEAVPTTVGVLDGEGNTDPVRVFQTPGSASRYSGGGYTIVQLLVSDVTGRPFHEVMRTDVLDPIGMRQSTYEQPLPIDMRGDVAFGYRADGSPVDGDWHIYPEQAAAGLWTTPSDLARYAMEVQRAVRGESDLVISQSMARTMLTPDDDDQGLGPAIDPAGPLFRHGGSNEGYRSSFVAYINEGRGAFVMTNSDNGSPLALQILHAIAREYDWPAPTPAERVPVTLEREMLEGWTGDYDVPDVGVTVEVRVEGDTLRALVPGQTMTLIPMSDSTFFDRRTGSVVRFGGNAAGARTITVSGVTGTRSSGGRPRP